MKAAFTQVSIAWFACFMIANIFEAAYLFAGLTLTIISMKKGYGIQIYAKIYYPANLCLLIYYAIHFAHCFIEVLSDVTTCCCKRPREICPIRRWLLKIIVLAYGQAVWIYIQVIYFKYKKDRGALFMEMKVAWIMMIVMGYITLISWMIVLCIICSTCFVSAAVIKEAEKIQ